MSREWTRARRAQQCAYCGQPVAVGDPVLVVTLPNVDSKFAYCASCKGPAPPDLPTATPPPAALKPVPLTRLGAGMLPLDWKQRGGGEREPGQEG